MIELSAEQIAQNWAIFRKFVNTAFPSRQSELNAMYDDLEEKLVTMPASSVDYYHNAFAGGYVDHVLRVIKFSKREYMHWKDAGLKVDNFTLEELLFAATHHDLGKVGLPGFTPYPANTSKWHRENQGKMYSHDSSQPFTLVPDTSLFLLQHYGIKCTWQEQLAIRTHDGVYDRANEAYYFSKSLDSKSRTNINQILHNADFMAARFEFERWATANASFQFYNEKITQPEIKKPITIDATNSDHNQAFDAIFKK